jgi:CPA2 family monovalent cation:H+ antiporter-2
MLDTVMPIQSILMMVFFVSIGLLIDLSLVWANLGVVVVMLLVATVGKTLVNLAVFSALRLPWAQALLTALVLSQVGEFSFLLGSIGFDRGVISAEEFRIIISVTALSLAVSPLWMGAARRLHRVATFQRVSVRYVFRIAFGREADRISGAGAMTVRFGRRAIAMLGGRARTERVRVEPQIEDTRAEKSTND